MSKNKTAIAFALFLMFAMTFSLVALPAANAHTPPWTIPTYAYLNVAPDPAGVGQIVTVGMWLQGPTPTANGVYGDRWENFNVKVTKPDGTTQTLGPYTSDATGGTFTTYTPDKTGNYTFVFTFPGQTLAGNNLIPGLPAAFYAYIGDYFEPSTSKVVTLEVQQEPIPLSPQAPLPTNYWTRPVQSVNGLWYNITGNWLGLGVSSFATTGSYNASGNYNPYTKAPATAHILWTKPAAFGGLIGGEFGGGDVSSNFYSTSQYEPKYAPIIMNGVLYYEQYPGASTNPAGFVAVDLRTGQTLWTKNTLDNLRCGQLLDYVSPNQFGAIAYLWTTGTVPTGTYKILSASYSGGSSSAPRYVTAPVTSADSFTGTTYNMYDALTGNYILSIVNGTSLALTEDQNGDLIGYYVNSTNPNAPTLNMWNSTQAIEYPTPPPEGFSLWEWRPPQNAVIQFSAGIMWSVPIATNISGVPFPSTLSLSNTILGPSSINSGVILLAAAATSSFGLPAGIIGAGFMNGFEIEAGYSATTGQQLWITNRTQPLYTRIQLIGIGNGAYALVNLETATVTGYSLNTGSQLWTTPLTNPNPYDSSGGYMGVLANGVLYAWSFGGGIWAINMADGKIIWQTNTTTLHGDAGANTPYGIWPLWTFTVGTVADGILFVPEGHEYSPPLFHGAQQLAINITDGQLVWSIMSFDVTNAPAIADGIMTVLNAYDNQIYAYGMGPTKTTVSAPSVGITTATPVTITGTVLDISAGVSQQGVAANFPNGLPAVSDASMSDWMQFVYMQQPCPANVTGVPVTISAIDPNGNYVTLGNTISDGSGFYSFTVDTSQLGAGPGKYTIIATFAGSDSYYPSSSEAAFTVMEEPAATPSPTPAAQAPVGTYFIASTIAIIVAIVIVGILILRKH
jgi:hypothetical protein